jgi:hypothetical protein
MKGSLAPFLRKELDEMGGLHSRRTLAGFTRAACRAGR